ncbi:MAG TPA: dihydrolipoamide acetyltransferase family protein [Thermoplasmata archaeon]|nr:dihydrolipoamide acetyltransferase family protein [Thermoplasmata archaeon]
MAKEFKLPDIGEGVHEGEITKWLVKEGDPIKEEQLFVEVMTDKVTVQLPSPYTGTVLKLLAREGEVVRVGNAIVVIGEEGEAVAPPGAPTAPPAPPGDDPDLRPVGLPSEPPPPPAASPGEVLATPAVRRLARELSVDLATVPGTGPRGRVTEEDVHAAHLAPAVPVSAPTPAVTAKAPSAGGREERIAVKGVRRLIAERMHKSTTTAAHFTFVEEVDMTPLVHLRDKMKGKAEKRGVKLTYLPFIVRALVASLKEYPWLNASLDDEKQEIVVKRYYNIGIATATDAGLVVPVIHEADGKDLFALAAEIERLAEAARTAKLTPHDVAGGTFTVTSLGALGGILATPIINWPEVAIVGIHRIEKRPVVREERVEVRDMMYLTCSFDHRVIDGHVGAAFVETLKEYLEHPALLFVEA